VPKKRAHARRTRPRHGWLYALPEPELPTLVTHVGVRYEREETFKHDFFAATGLYRGPDGLAVLKLGRQNDFLTVPMKWLGSFLTQREVRVYAQMQGVPGVPRLIGPVGIAGFLHAFVPGHPLGRYEQVSDTFFDELFALLQAMHARHIAYVDLNKRQNILVSEDGKPHLIDFQISWHRPRRWAGNTRPARWLLRRLQASDRYHLMKHTPEAPEGYPSTYSNETIVIGDQRYSRGDLSYPVTLEMVAEHIPTKERTLEQLNLLIDIETMPEETIDGVDCYHYRGTVDLEKWLDWMRPDLERMYEWILKDMIERYPDFDFDHEEMKKTAEYMLVNAYEETYEFWIGKDDYLIRQWKHVMQSLINLSEVGYSYLAVSTSKYYDFNEPIMIEPPLTESGELLPGWSLSSLE